TPRSAATGSAPRTSPSRGSATSRPRARATAGSRRTTRWCAEPERTAGSGDAREDHPRAQAGVVVAQLELADVELGDGAHQGQSQAAAGRPAARVAAVEALAPPRLLGVGNSRAVVRDGDLDRAVAAAARLDRDLAVAGRELHRVVDEVADRLGEQHRVAA